VAANDRYSSPYPGCTPRCESNPDPWEEYRKAFCKVYCNRPYDDPYKEYEYNSIYGPKGDSGRESTQASGWAYGQNTAQEPRKETAKEPQKQNGWAYSQQNGWDWAAWAAAQQNDKAAAMQNAWAAWAAGQQNEKAAAQQNDWAAQKPDSDAMTGTQHGGVDQEWHNPCPKPPMPPCPKPPEPPCPKPPEPPCPKPPELPCFSCKPPENPCPKPRKDHCPKPRPCPKPPEPKPPEIVCHLLRRDPCKKHPHFFCWD
jgi:hypothetical protein